MSSNSESKIATLNSKDAMSLRKELQDIRNRINFLLDSFDSGDANDRYGVSAMADALQEKTAGIGAASTNSLDPSDSRSGTGLDTLPNSNGPFQHNNISSENSKEFDPFNAGQKQPGTLHQQQRVQDDQVSVASHNSSTTANVRQEPEITNTGGGFQRPDVASIPPSTVAPQPPQQPGAYQGAYNPGGYSVPQQAPNQQIGAAPSIQAPPSTNIQSPPQPGQQPVAPNTGYNPYPQQQHGYQQPGAMQAQNQAPTAGPTQVPPGNQAMYQQQYQQQGYQQAGAQPTQGVPPRGPPIGPPQTMTSPGANPYGMGPRGQGPASSNGTFSRYPQSPAYR